MKNAYRVRDKDKDKNKDRDDDRDKDKDKGMNKSKPLQKLGGVPAASIMQMHMQMHMQAQRAGVHPHQQLAAPATSPSFISKIAPPMPTTPTSSELNIHKGAKDKDKDKDKAVMKLKPIQPLKINDPFAKSRPVPTPISVVPSSTTTVISNTTKTEPQAVTTGYSRKSTIKVTPKMGYLFTGQDRINYLQSLNQPNDNQLAGPTYNPGNKLAQTLQQGGAMNMNMNKNKNMNMNMNMNQEGDEYDQYMSGSEDSYDSSDDQRNHANMQQHGNMNHRNYANMSFPGANALGDRSQSRSDDDDDDDTTGSKRNSLNTNKKLNKVFWTKEEDEKLATIVENYGAKRWELLARTYMPHRNGMQLRSRWTYVINRKDSRRPFTSDEDLLILKEYQEHPGSWSYIARMLYNRTDQEVKHRFRKLQRKAKKIARQRGIPVGAT
mmetsp:Transcript_19825/g.34036  ORF Transcript_19825/g.34036 Transcript_19825/m.34036 type:complete len:436 (+) Transcript_19825:218-1525(+)